MQAANQRAEAVELPGKGFDAFPPADASLELYVAQRRMRALVPGAEVLTLDTGHAPQLVRPDEPVAGIVRFLATRF